MVDNTTNITNTPDSAGVTVPPPLIYAGSLVVGLLLHRRFPVKVLPRRTARRLGSLCVVLAIFLVRSAFREMQRAGTTVDPSQPVKALVTEGPFRITRNPLYLSLTLLYAGISLIVDTLWTMLLLPFVLLAIHFGVIAREERYLERRFGQQYLSYKAKVRRWL